MLERLRFATPHLVMFGLSLALYAAALQIDTSSSARRIGPDFWPKLVVGFMALLCAYEAVRRLLFGPAAPKAAAPLPTAPLPAVPQAGADAAPDAAPDEAPEPTHVGQLAGGTALVVGYVLAVPWLGFFLTTAVFLAGFAWIGGFRRPLLSLAIGAVGALVMVTLFMRVAYISLPLGEGVFRQLSTALLALLGVK